MRSFAKIYGRLDGAKGTYTLSTETQSLVTSIIDAGEFLGAVSAFIVGERYGRRGGLFISSAIVCLGTILQLAGDHLRCLTAGRLVMGTHYLLHLVHVRDAADSMLYVTLLGSSPVLSRRMFRTVLHHTYEAL